ncbi:hypothetical protein ANN_10178 [Periplaneta americana]|uniref:Uncharacterized protein n=1 Tax=Periplaneta americana TaxID=6978 RepID=A0ABQ8TNF1_PERAM|nr:hypothetical protein ANN_10178 [Periplaneta americana]
MAGLCEDGNEPPGSLKAICKNMDITTKRIEAFEMWIWRRMERVKWTERLRNEAVLERVGEKRVILKLIKKRKMNWLGHWLRRNCLLKDELEEIVNRRRVRSRRSERDSYLKLYAEVARNPIKMVAVITEDVQNVHLLHEYRPHIDVSLTCEHDPKLQEYCVCPQNMPQFDSEGIPNQAPETNKPTILNGPTSRNREGASLAVASRSKASCLGLALRNARWFESSWEKKFSHDISANVWDRCPPSIVMHLGSYDR